MRKMEKLAPKNKEEEQRDQKYSAFKRTDAHLTHRLAFYFMAPFVLPRIIIGWLFAIGNAIFISILTSITGTEPNMEQKGFEKFLIRISTAITGRVVLFSSSCLYIEEKRPKVCYKKYLGPDWTADYEKCGSIVSNHSSWMDILIHMTRQPPSHVSKASVRKIPGVGKIAEAVGCLFLDRGDNN